MKKKILFIHTTYRSLGGEDIAVRKEYEFLKQHYDVRSFYLSNNSENLLNDIFIFAFNRNYLASLKLKKIVREFKPEIAYIHNTWYKGSLSIFYTLSKLKIPYFIKLHNFRYFCTKTFSSKNHLAGQTFCQACGYRKTQGFNKYFKDSYLKSYMMNMYGRKYFEILKKDSKKIFVLTKFHKNFLKSLGVDNKKISVFPNYLDHKSQKKSETVNDYFVYAGRISEEKGVEQLIKAFNNCKLENIKLIIVGNGPKYKEYSLKYNSENVVFKNQMKNEETLNLIAGSKCVVTATKLYEGQPTLLCEASLLGIPSIFPTTGGVEEFFPSNYNYSFQQYSYVDLENKLKSIVKDIPQKIGKNNQEFIKAYLDKEKLLNLFNGSLEAVTKE